MRTYHRIENAIREPLISDVTEFLNRRAIIQAEGFDPAMSSLRRLELTAVKLKVRGWSAHRRKEDLIAIVSAALTEITKGTSGEIERDQA